MPAVNDFPLYRKIAKCDVILDNLRRDFKQYVADFAIQIATDLFAVVV